MDGSVLFARGILVLWLFNSPLPNSIFVNNRELIVKINRLGFD
jgi:hypothetical protein